MVDREGCHPRGPIRLCPITTRPCLLSYALSLYVHKYMKCAKIVLARACACAIL